jgi:alpha-galactosidase
VTGLYDVLATLRQRHPDLMIENVSGGGNRVDYGMLGLTDVAWMDDRTAPSIHVRHNFEGLGTAMPPSYLFSFVIDHVGESLQYGDDIPLYIRSRMAGVLGLTFRSADLSGSTASEIAEHIRIYKGFRDTIREGSSVLLTSQAAIDNPPAWDALQVTDSAGRSLLFAFQIDQGVGRVTLRLRGLKPDAAYDVESIDAGPIGRASGADLMASGVEIVAGPASAAHLLILTETAR